MLCPFGLASVKCGCNSNRVLFCCVLTSVVVGLFWYCACFASQNGCNAKSRKETMDTMRMRLRWHTFWGNASKRTCKALFTWFFGLQQ